MGRSRERASSDGFVDFYAVLGVPPSATQDEIARAFRAKAKQLHPDVSPDPDAARRFEQLVAANDVVSDPRRRGEYDSRRNWFVGTAAAGPSAPPGEPPRARIPRVEPWRQSRPRPRIPFAIGFLVLGAVFVMSGYFRTLIWTGQLTSKTPQAAGTVATVATRERVNDVPGVMFVTKDGQEIHTYDPTVGDGEQPPGTPVKIRYLEVNPRVVSPELPKSDPGVPFPSMWFVVMVAVVLVSAWWFFRPRLDRR